VIYNQMVTWTAFAILAMFHSKNKIEGHTEGIGENHMKMATSSMY